MFVRADWEVGKAKRANIAGAEVILKLQSFGTEPESGRQTPSHSRP